MDQGHGADSHYTVASGDSLSNIAASHGTDWQSLYSANQGVIGDDPNAIRPGETLNIPGHDLSADGHSNTAGVDLSGVGGAAEPASYDDWDAGAHSDTPDLDHPDFDHADHPVHDAGDVHDPNDFQTDQPDHIDDTWHHT